MPFERETLTQLRADASADMQAQLPGADPLLRFANLRIVMTVLAGMANQQYGYIDWGARMAVPFTAEDEFLYAWGALKDVYLKAATQAGDPDINGGGATTFTGCTPTVGGVPLLPVGSELQRGDNVAFITLADATVADDGTLTVNIEAVDPGAAGNCPVGTVLTLGSNIAGIQSNSVVSTAVTGGADIETQDEFRSRMLQAYQQPPQGGAQADYVKWALAVPGVTRAWCQPLGMGAGSVTVFFMMDDVESAYGGFPQGTNGVATLETRASPATGDQLLLANNLFPQRPVTALVYAAAPVDDAIAFTFKNISDPTIQAAVEAAIDDVFLTQGSVGGTIDLNTGEAGGQVNLIDLQAAVAAVPGFGDGVMVSPTDNIVAATGYLPTRGAMTWE
jgi:uncharacterized phage protein gp47/JayE